MAGTDLGGNRIRWEVESAARKSARVSSQLIVFQHADCRQYIAKDRYQNVIISPFYEEDSTNLTVHVTSDLWQPVAGWASLTWYDWNGKALNVNGRNSVPVTVGAINSTQILAANISSDLHGIDLTNAVLFMETSVRGELPNSRSSQEFRHQNWFHPTALSKAKLVDPVLKIVHLPEQKRFRVTATEAIAAWVWIDYPSGVLLHFEQNGFWLRPNVALEVAYEVKWDSTGGRWPAGVTAESLWDLTQT
jgi:beta-mannosidase